MRAKTKKWFSPLFVLTLAVAGIFGVSAAVVDKQKNEICITEKANASTNYKTTDFIYVDVSGFTDWAGSSATIRAGCLWKWPSGQESWKDYSAAGSAGTLQYDNVYKCYFPKYDNAVGAGAVRASSGGELWNHRFYSDSDVSSGKFIKITGWDDSGNIYNTATVTIKEVKSDATGTVLATKTFPIASGQSTATSVFTSKLSTYTNYTFDDYYTTASGSTKSSTVSSDVTIFARYTPNTYTITYKDKGGSSFSGTHAAGYPTGYTYGVATDLKGATKSGYTFSGWFDNISCTGSAVTSISAGSTGNKTFYALWEAVAATYTVTFAIADGQTGWGSFTGGTSITGVPEGSSISTSGSSITINGTTITATPASSTAQYSYAFSSWSNNTGTITANRTITASFTQTVRSYTVSFSKNGVTTTSFPTSQTVQYNGKVTTPSTPAANGYNFGGWYKEAGCVNAWNFSTDVITGARTLYAKWNEYTDFWISFDNGATKTQLTKVTSASGTELYQLSTASTLTVAGGESITFWKGATAGSAVAFTYESNGLTADMDASNNVITTDNTWKVRNFAEGINVYFKVTSSATGYFFYLGGKTGTISSATYGVESGETFYVQDLLKKNEQSYESGTNFHSEVDGNPTKIAVYFYDPVGDLNTINVWTDFYNNPTTTDDIDLYAITVPQYHGKNMKWGGVVVARYTSNVATPGWDNTMKRNADPTLRHGINKGHFTDDAQNCVQLQYWWGSSIDDNFCVNGNYTMLTDEGLETGTGIYVDPTNAWGNWDFSGDTASYHIYGYFFSIIEGDGAAYNWSAAATKVPGTTNLWEFEAPKDKSGNSVEWAKLIVVYSPSADWVTGQNKYQSQDLWYSSSLKTHTHITFTGNEATGAKSEAAHDGSYTDITRALSWGQRFVSAGGVECNGGTTPPSTSRWNTAKNEYNAMSSVAKSLVTNATGSESGSYYEQAVARYDYIIRKYGKTTYSDFAGRIAAGKLVASQINNFSPFSLITGDDSDNVAVILIIIASSISILSITALSVLMVKKKKSADK